MSTHSSLKAAQKVLQQRWGQTARFGVILGTGADEVAQQIKADVEIPYGEIPGFPNATAIGHRGQLVCGKLGQTEIIAMQGRFHLYEGYSHQQVRFPLQLMRSLGVELLLISNAAGGLNPFYKSGELMVLTSHIDLMFRSWPMASDQSAAGRPHVRADVYDRSLIKGALSHARREGFVLHQGVYAGLLGPNYETRAEYRFLRKIGADVVGMSTIPEVVYAADLGMRVMAFSIVANVAKPDVLEPTSGEEVIDAAAVAAPHLCSLFNQIIENA